MSTWNNENYNKNFIKCPHCGYEDHEWWEYVDPTEMDGDFNISCGICDEQIHVVMTTDVWFETSKTEEEE